MASSLPCSSRPSSTLISGFLNLSTIARLIILENSSWYGAVLHIVGCFAGSLDTGSKLYPSGDKARLSPDIVQVF